MQGEFSPTTFQAGPNFYIGNHRNADGRYQPLIRGHETPEFEQKDATQLAEQFGKQRADDMPLKRLSREDLDLICFEYVTG